MIDKAWATIAEIECQGDRIWLYPERQPSSSFRYHIIADVKRGREVRVGDLVQYEPYGLNFGWLVTPETDCP